MASKPSPHLLTLPIELRLQLYELLWISLPSCIHPKTSTLPASGVASCSSTALALLLVCRQIYAEARKIAYARHTFALTRNFDTAPLHHGLPRTYPLSLITSLVIPGYRSLPPFPTACPARCYTFKVLCSLVRRFRNLRFIVVVEDEEGLNRRKRSITSRKAHINFRMRKANMVGDHRFVPSYNITSLTGTKFDEMWRWALSVAVGEGKFRTVELLLCSLAYDGFDVPATVETGGHGAAEEQ